ncbi:extensin family protein [Sphingobium subterraneum]|uniref:Extensin-like C-terminal domain-containing protein n=1 Tax=Sphingobium subterraneum TaxID=627688 RepID=A0A841IYC6_9SPHN|nr:extensin family protein [Sphingobium subterraneum]MBB6123949.1 hypothetical protein [Sphingobium subterraneum]
MRLSSVFGIIKMAAVIVLLLLGGLIAFAFLKPGPQDVPWTALRLGDPVGIFTGRKIAALTAQREQCIGLLRNAGLVVEALPPLRLSEQCAAPDRVRLAPGQAMLVLSPTSVAPSCPVVAATAVWHWQVLQPAAQRIFGTSLREIEHLGSFSCRRIYGRETGTWSEHATADALDVSGFVLADGRRISVVRDWSDTGDKGTFLRIARDGACGLFATVLSPDYNAAHRDHFHLDQAERGSMRWRVCR